MKRAIPRGRPTRANILTYFRLELPADNRATPTQAHTLIQSLAAIGWHTSKFGWQYPLSFRFLLIKEAGQKTIRLLFGIPLVRAQSFPSAFRVAYPHVHLIAETNPLASSPVIDRCTLAVAFRKGGHGLEKWLPLAELRIGGQNDPLDGVLVAMGQDTASQWVLDVLMTPLRDRRFQRAIAARSRSPAQRSNTGFSLSEVLAEVFGSSPRPRQPAAPATDPILRLRPLVQSRIKATERPFQVSVRLLATGSMSARAHLHAMQSAMTQLRSEGRLVPSRMSTRHLVKAIGRGTATRPMWWMSGELASLIHLPDPAQPGFSHVVPTRGIVLPPPTALPHGLRLGWSNFPGAEGQEIRISLSQAAKHTFLAGATGSGKTTTLLHIMLGMIEEMKSQPQTAPGFTFFDPHGGAIERLLSHIPPTLHDKVHVIPLGPTPFPRGLNLFRMEHRSDAEAITGEFVTTLQELWPGSRPRSEHYLRNNVLSLLSAPPQTVLGIAHLFSDERFRQRIVPSLPPHLQQFWTGEFAEIRNIADHLGPLWNKLGALTTYPSLRRVLGQTQSTIHTRTVMDDGHIVLIDGSGCTTDAVKIIAGLYLIDLHFTCKRRPEHRSRLHIFFGDESHLYAVNVLQKILAEDRKFGLSLFLATQYLDQLPDPILAGILGNVGTLILLQLGGPDADRLTRWLKPDVASRDLMALPEMNALVRTKRDGGATELFSIQSPLVSSGHGAWAEQAKAHSDQVDGRPEQDVDDDILAMYPADRGRGSKSLQT